MKRLLGAVGAMLLLAACNLSSQVVVRPDGSGTYTVTITAPAGSQETGDALYSSLRRAAAKAGVPLTVTKFSSAGESGAQGEFTFQSLADLTRESAALSQSGTGLNAVHVRRGTQGWHFDAASTDGLVTAPGVAAGSPGGNIDASALAGLVHLAVVVQLPGQPAENNASAVTHTATDSSFTWELAVGRTATPLQAATSFVGDQATIRQATALTPIRPTVLSGTAAIGQGGSTSSNTSGSGHNGQALAVGLGVGATALVLGVGSTGLIRRRRAPAASDQASAQLPA